MADTFTPSLNLCKPEINQSAQTWGIKLNSDLDLLDTFAASAKSFMASNDAHINALIAAVIPRGCIIAWSGGAGSVPAGWLLCNGQNGTPNLTDRFILGNTGNRGNWEAGGAFSVGATTDTQGYHGHGGAIGGTVLTWGQMPVHNHSAWTDVQGDHSHSIQANYVIAATSGFQGGQGGWFNNSPNTSVNGAHGHNVGIGNAGNNEAHTHGLSIYGDGSHAHNVTVTTVPPYFSLAYIMRA
jgi:hypothetical protein